MKNENFYRILKDDASITMKEDLNWKLLKNKRILITGGTGFIASYFIKILFFINEKKKLNLKVDCTVRKKKDALKIFDNKNYFNNFLSIKECSILQKIKLQPKYNYIFHTASIATPKFFASNPIEVVLPNTLGTIRLLEFSELNKLDKFIFFSTTGVNGHVDDKLRPIVEDVYGPLDPTKIENCYLESKRMGENLCFAWFAQKKIPIQIIRPAITYGPGVKLDDGRSYADFFNSLVNNKDLILYSSGKAVRNFCYIADFVIGLMHVFLKGKKGEVYNLSEENEYSIKVLAKLLTNKIFKEKKLKVVYNKKKNKFLRVNFNKTTVSTKKARALGWKTRFDIEAGMRRTISSYYLNKN